MLTSGTEAAVYRSGQHPGVTFPSGSHVLLREKPGPVKNWKNGSCFELCLLDARDHAKSLMILTHSPLERVHIIRTSEKMETLREEGTSMVTQLRV